MALSDFRASVDMFVKDKQWYWHLPLWLFGLYIFVKMFDFNMGGEMPSVLLVPYSFDFILHEFAHIFTAFLPPLITAASGSGSELLLGAGLVIGALWFSNYFALLYCLLWLDLVLQSVGTYMADAVPQALPLVSLGGALSGQDALHDWHFIFGQLHMLDASAFIGNSLRVAGHIAGFVGIAFSAWLIAKMAIAASEQKAARTEPVAKPTASFSSDKQSPTTPNPVYPEATRGNLAPRKPPKDLTPH